MAWRISLGATDVSALARSDRLRARAETGSPGPCGPANDAGDSFTSICSVPAPVLDIPSETVERPSGIATAGVGHERWRIFDCVACPLFYQPCRGSVKRGVFCRHGHATPETTPLDGDRRPAAP